MHPLHQKILKMIEGATEGMSEEQLTHHEAEKWSAATILEHLSMAYGGTAKAMQRCAEAGKPLGEVPNLKQRIIDMVVLELKFFPEGRKAPKQVTPTGGLGGMESLEGIKQNLAAMDAAWNACNEKFGNTGYLANHPVLGPLTLAQWPKFHFVHTRHHMRQVEAIRAKLHSKTRAVSA